MEPSVNAYNITYKTNIDGEWLSLTYHLHFQVIISYLNFRHLAEPQGKLLYQLKFHAVSE